MLSVLNVATPPTAATVTLAPPERCAPVVPVPDVIATVTLAVDVVRLPPASSIRTVTAGEIVAPPVADVGCWPNATVAAGPAVRLKVLEVAAVSTPDVALSRYPAPTLSMLSPL